MAQPAGTQDTYGSIGNREDLSDIIYNIAPYETPLLTAMKKCKADAALHEWQTDDLDAPSGTNRHVEGDDAAPEGQSPTVRLNNFTQIFKKHVVVTGTQEKVRKAGRRSEVAYQTAKKMKELKTDMEMSIMGVNQAKVGGDSTTARVMGSIQSYLTENTTFGATGADPTGNGVNARTDGTQAAFTENMLKDVLELTYANGANPTMLFVGPHNKRVASGFAGNAERQIDVKGNTNSVMATVDVYVGDFATLKIVPSRHIRPRDALLIDPEYATWAELRPTFQDDLAKTGDSMRKQIICEATLAINNPNAHGGVFDLTTAT